ncbi:FtsX-like permease family protein [Microbacterium esteraromaticum]|uniref:FtsX-like permease family protein n=1 Tax=Microbacterium esteraromaticum TaxID=57043 RepID=UPI00195DD2C6|nr:FtsX-like permease family protein [Microbacterium esteraromaticum]MBM7467392.1 ABC-type lipoprotein release transport system permease subunit [Microbacterium esteraromaticum]
MTSAIRRAGEHIGRLALLAFVVAVVVAGVGGIAITADRLLTRGTAEILRDAEPAARSVRVVATEADEAAAQDEKVRDAIDPAFEDAPITIARQVSLEVSITAPDSGASKLRVMADDRIPELAEITSGEWPQHPGEIALPDAAAQLLGVGAGDRLTVGTPGGEPVPPARDRPVLEVVGTWRAHDPAGVAWHGDPSVVSGQSDGVIGPAVAAADTLAAQADSPTVSWEITPARVDLASLSGLQRGVARLDALPEKVDPGRAQNTQVAGTLAQTLDRQSAAVAATRGLLIAPQLIIALLGALVLGIVLSSLSTARADELGLLRARGASARRLALSAAGETAVFALTGAAIAIVALAMLIGLSSEVVLLAGGAVVAAALMAALLTVRSARRADAVRPDAQRSDAGLRSLTALLLPAGVAIALGALAGWQLFTTRTVVRPDGTTEPLAAAAPTLLLIAACVLAPLAAGPLAALSERLLRGSRGITPILPLRQLARRMNTVAVAILCLSLAAAAAALAAMAPFASDAAEQRTTRAMLGEDVRLISADELAISATEAEKWNGVSSASDVLYTPLTVGSDTATLVAGPEAAVGLTAPLPASSGETLPAQITASLADRLGAEQGTTFTARIRSINQPVSIVVAGVVDSLPGVGSGLGVATEPTALERLGLERPANELWLSSDDPPRVAELLRAQAVQPVRILTAAQVSAAPVTSLAQRMLTAGALVAALLGAIGFVAATSATARARRDEALVLRALGLVPSAHRAMRMGENMGIALYAVVTGAILGAAVAGSMLPIVLGVGS